MATKRIGILTGGGDCPELNAAQVSRSGCWVTCSGAAALPRLTACSLPASASTPLGLIVRREFGKMLALREAEVAAITIQQAIAKLHTVDPNGDLASTAEALGISLGR